MDFDLAIDAVISDLEAFEKKFATNVFDTVRDKTPVKTGKARDGWTLDLLPGKAIISNDVEYITYLELGTPTMRPRGMVSTTLAEIDAIVGRSIV